MIRCAGGGHKTILTATDDMFRRIATPFVGAPARQKGNVGHSLDLDLYNCIRERTTVWNSDAAADEQLAGQESKIWSPSSDDVRPLLPSLKFVNRDKAHASRRVIQRPWFADAVLKSVYTHFTAIMAAVQKSHVLKKWYVEFQTRQCEPGDSPGCGNCIITTLFWISISNDFVALPKGEHADGVVVVPEQQHVDWFVTC